MRTKFERLGIGRFLGPTEPAGRGNLHFRCPDVEGFRSALAGLGFRQRDRAGGAWDAREPVPRLSLHCKHFAGWPADRIQAHIDPYGIGGPLTALLHLLDYHGYRDEERISRLLVG